MYTLGWSCYCFAGVPCAIILSMPDSSVPPKLFLWYSGWLWSQRINYVSAQWNFFGEVALNQIIWKESNYRPHSEASEGYVFTGVCHSLSTGGWHQMHHGIGHMITPHPMSHSPHHPMSPPIIQCSPTTPGTTVNSRAVRILLECILVLTVAFKKLALKWLKRKGFTSRYFKSGNKNANFVIFGNKSGKCEKEHFLK